MRYKTPFFAPLCGGVWASWFSGLFSFLGLMHLSATGQPPTAQRLPPVAVRALADDEIRSSVVGRSDSDESRREEVRKEGLRAALEQFAGGHAGSSVSDRLPTLTLRGSREPNSDEFVDGRGKVGMTIDDMPVADLFGRDLAQLGFERMGLFRSPRGAEVGVPHAAGLIEVQSRLPGREWESALWLGAGQRDAVEARGEIAGPVVADRLAFSAGAAWRSREGDFHNSATGRPYGEQRRAEARTQWRLTPTPAWEVLLTAGIQRSDDDTPVWVAVVGNRALFTVAKPDTGRDVRAQHYQALRATYVKDGVTMKSISSHRRFRDDFEDPTFLAGLLPFPSHVQMDQDFETWTQEVRAESADGRAPLRWRTGLFAADTDFSQRTRQTPLADMMRRTRGRDLAWYGSLSREVTSAGRIGVGLRTQRTSIATRAATRFLSVPAGVPPFTTDGARVFSGALPTLELEGAPAATGQWWARYSMGRQPGGFRRALPESRDYEAETSRHWEAGGRIASRERRAVFGLVGYYTVYRDYQVLQATPTDLSIANARRAHAVGVEAESAFVPIPGWRLFANGSVGRARYDEFQLGGVRFDGRRISNVPAYTVAAGGEWRAGGGAFSRVEWRLVGRTEFDETNTVGQSARGVINARVGWERGRWSVSLWGRNVSDTVFFNSGVNFLGTWVGTPGAPRRIGVDVVRRY